MKGLLGPLKAAGAKPATPLKAAPKTPVKAAPKIPLRPSGQFASQREKDGKVNGPGLAEPAHPSNHKDFEAL